MATWADLPSIWKHIFYLSTGGNFTALCKLKECTGMEMIRCAWSFGVEVFGMLWFFFLGVSKDWMLSLFVTFKLFWMVFWEQKIESVCSLSIIEEAQVLVESIEDNFWEAKDEKYGFLIDRFESLDWPCL